MNHPENATENVVPTRGEALRIAVLGETRQSRVSHNRLAVESGISPVRLKNWLESKSRGDASIIENALTAWRLPWASAPCFPALYGLKTPL